MPNYLVEINSKYNKQEKNLYAEELKAQFKIFSEAVDKRNQEVNALIAELTESKIKTEETMRTTDQINRTSANLCLPAIEGLN